MPVFSSNEHLYGGIEICAVLCTQSFHRVLGMLATFYSLLLWSTNIHIIAIELNGIYPKAVHAALQF